MFTELWLPPDVELDCEVNGMCKGGNVVIGWGWIIIAGKWKLTDSKDCSRQLGFWNEDDEKDDSLLDECSSELLPDVDNIGICVIGILDLSTLLENSLLGSERAWTFFCEVSDLVWGFPGARIIALIQNRQIFPPHWTNRGKYWNPGKTLLIFSPQQWRQFMLFLKKPISWL